MDLSPTGFGVAATWRSRLRRRLAGGSSSRNSKRVDAGVHLADAAELSALRGPKKHAKTDWADARHQRELLLIGGLPESRVPPEHILDLRARVRLRHEVPSGSSVSRPCSTITAARRSGA